MSMPVMTSDLVAELEQTGILVFDDLLTREQLEGMQQGFRSRLARLRWNDHDGYEKTDRYRLMVQDVLTLAPGFVELALHPVLKEIMHAYLGPEYALVEAKGWRSVPTHRDFHGWHGDAWYDQTKVTGVQRELKLAVYLTDVRSGAFNYIKGTHRQIHPHIIGKDELAKWADHEIREVLGRAGTVCMFDTSGIHRQATPILEPREAVFYCFHDPAIPLQQEDIDYYRYHPLVLNAAFLGDLSAADERILGFGDRRNYVPAFERKPRHERTQSVMRRGYDWVLAWDQFSTRVRGRLRRLAR
ncbi:MAG: phytanoyl-CoA dioxygenase family protein [Gemmatimonadetes bacterium]|nr:phytanoyl-CoA dioxygenase family protein [Gemmatimonadota bacterium]